MSRIGPDKDDMPSGSSLSVGLLVRLLGILLLTIAAALVAEQRRPRLSALQAPRSRRTISLPPRPALTFDAVPAASEDAASEDAASEDVAPGGTTRPAVTPSGPVGTDSAPVATDSVLAAAAPAIVASRPEQAATVLDETEIYPDPWSVVADLVSDDDDERSAPSPVERLRGRWNDWVYTTPMSQIIWTAVALAGTLIVITVGIVVVSQR